MSVWCQSGTTRTRAKPYVYRRNWQKPLRTAPSPDNHSYILSTGAVTSSPPT